MLWLNTLAYFESISLQRGCHLLEHPRDPGQAPFPSFWDTEVTRSMEERCGAVRVDFDQCPFGGLTKKATTVSTTLPNACRLCRSCPGVSASHRHCRSEGVDENGEFHTRKLEVYPAELCKEIALLFLESFSAMAKAGTGPGGSTVTHPRRPVASRWSVERGRQAQG